MLYVREDQEFEEAGASYTLTFQNKQGDWLLTGHVPWQYVSVLCIYTLHTFIHYFAS